MTHDAAPLLLCCAAALSFDSRLPPETTLCIEAFLDHSRIWTLESASHAGFLHLLQRLAPGECRVPMAASVRTLRRRNGIRQAAVSGRLPVLQWWMSAYFLPSQAQEEPSFQLIFECAVRFGHLHILQWLQAQNQLPSARAVDNFIECDHPDVIYWLHEHNITLPLLIAVDRPAQNGDLAFLAWIHRRSYLFPEVVGWSKVGYYAAKIGSLDILLWLQLNRPHNLRETALVGALETGQLESVQWLHANGIRSTPENWTPHELETVDVPMTEWILTKFQWFYTFERRIWCMNAMVNAARLGRLDALQLLYQEGIVFQDNSHLMKAAAMNGHLDTLQWLHAQDVTCNAGAMDEAAANGHLQVVEWLHANRSEGCTSQAIKKAAFNGHLAVVQWLHEHKAFRLDRDLMLKAAWRGHLSVVQYIVEHGDRSEWWTGQEMKGAAREGHIQTVRWMHENGLDGDVDLGMVISNGHLNVLRYLVLHVKMQFTTSDVLAAVHKDDFAILEWMVQHDAETVDQCYLAGGDELPDGTEEDP